MRSSVVVLATACLLAGCGGDPLRGVDRLSDLDLADDGAVAALPDAAERAPEGGLIAARTSAGPVPRAPAPEGGVLGYLRAQAEAGKAAEGAETSGDDGTAGGAEVAARSPDTGGGGGFLSALFGGGGAVGGAGPKPGAPDYAEVTADVTLPYGQLARRCGASPRQLGRRVDSYPDGGRGYALYDSRPGEVGPHTFYLTGFDDGCARQFTAAVAMFSAPSDFERLRYGPASGTLPASETDAAYETLKSRICRVGRGKPCGVRISRLERNTAFVSIYERLGSNARWKTVLLHDGAVLAADLRSN